MDDDLLKKAVEAARGRGEVREVVEGIYREVAEAVSERKPRCEASGRCCRFEEYGHRLYVTTMELAVFLDDLERDRGARPVQTLEDNTCGTPVPQMKSDPASTMAVGLKVLDQDGGGCRFQAGGLCSVHGIRPFGCRMFYCDPTAEDWQSDQYERFHARLKRAHDEMGVAYWYVEWRSALRAVMDAPVKSEIRNQNDESITKSE